MLVQGTVLKKATSVKKESEVAKLKEDTIAFALESALNMRLGTCTRILLYDIPFRLYHRPNMYTASGILLCTTLIDHWLFVCL